MALVYASMFAEIADKMAKPNASAALVWPTVGKAYCNTYLQAGMNAGGGATTAVAGVGTLSMELIEINSGVVPSGIITAVKIAKAFNNCLMTYMSVYQTVIVTAPGLPLLMNDIIEISSAPTASPVEYAQKICKALDAFTKTAIVTGIIPGSPPIPFTGPLS